MKPFSLAFFVIVLFSGCASNSAKVIRILDDNGAPLENAKISLSYMVSYTVPVWTAGPTDKNGYATLNGSYKIRKELHATVTTENEIIGFDYSRFGTLKDGVLTISTWRGIKSKIPENKGPDTLRVPSVYISK